MAEKLLGFLRVTAADGAVHVNAYKTLHGFGNDPAKLEHFRSIRVYRLEETGFTFGSDYAEYFDGLSHRDAELIFDGPIQAGNERKFCYEDRDVEIGATYVYWMGAADGEPVGPAPVKVRDPDVWWSAARVEREMTALKSDYPDDVSINDVGHTVRGKKLRAIRVGNAEKCIAFLGAVHAGEAGAEIMLPAFREILAGHKDLLSQVSLAAIPVVDLDERERLVQGLPWYLRTNANGVDLNRNFPTDWDTVEYGYGLDSSDPESMTYRGHGPACEPETRAVTALLREQPVEAVFSFHCLASICGMNMGGAKCAEGDVDYAARCRDFATAYLLGMDPKFPKDKAAAFYCTAGSLATWCYRELGVPAFDIEMSSQLEPDALAQCKADRTDVPLLTEYRKRHAAGITAVLKKIAAQE